ncbi:RHS repeat-associated core domain-containing protein, partial [Phocaeicola vulgatus]
SKGELVWEMLLDVYGKMAECHGDRTFVPFRYQGQYEDEETGLYYNRFRYYDPKTGNYISQDPIGLAGGNPTLYGYVFDPNTQIDPLGLDCSYVSKDFKDGASFLITKKDYLRFIVGKKNVGRVDGQFVIPKKEMDNLLKKTNGDIVQIERALGIPEGNWQDKGGLIRVDIPNPQDYNLRLPTANMSGANEKFELGGKTSGGIPEGVIDQVPKMNVIITKL